jgi:nicotinamidase-related amidase
LIDVADCVLVFIDMQDSFFDKYEKAKSEEVITKAVWLLRVAGNNDVPVVAMAEDIPNMGNLTDRIAEALPERTTVFNKDYFGCGDQVEILEAIKTTGRGTAILIGVETDVCVAHSALSLVKHDFDVVVVQDITATTVGDQSIGLTRIRDAGGLITSLKSLYYEWMRSVTGCVTHNDKDPNLKNTPLPSNLIL